MKLIFSILSILIGSTLLKAQTDSTYKNSKVYKYYKTREIELIERGKANLYMHNKNYYNPQVGSNSITRYYFNVGDGPVQKAKIKNLKFALKDNEASMKYIKNLKTFYWVSGITGVTGLVLAIANLGPVIRNMSNVDPNVPDEKVSPLLYTGIGMALVVNFTIILGPKPKKAVSIYNR